MAGTSSTAIIASFLGRHSVCVELEEKFCEWSRRNVERLEKAGKKHGEIKIVQGDARRLSEILGRADVAITSPPYSSTEFYYGKKSPEFWQILAEKTGRKAWLNPDSQTRKTIDEKEKPLSPENIGNLPLGEVSTIITSPPHGDTYLGGGDPEKRRERLIKAGRNPKDFLGGKARNAVLKHYGEVDVCLTSPPYSESMTKRRKGYTVIPELARTREMPQDTRDDNVANLPHGNIDAVITSPPYSESLQVQANPQREMQRIKEKFSEGKLTGRESIRLARKGKFNPHSTINLDRRYSNSEGNIGNLPHGSVDTIITSPPYANALSQDHDEQKQKEVSFKTGDPHRGIGKSQAHTIYSANKENIGNLPHGSIDAVITSPPYGEAMQERGGTQHKFEKEKKIGVHYSHTKTNIGNLPLGNIDAVITSPPYNERYAYKDPETKQADDPYASKNNRIHKPYSQNPNNIGNLKHGEIDVVLTSPPYGEAQEGSGIAKRGYQGSKHSPTDLVGKRSYMPDKFENPENISKLPHGNIDAIVTSPPYEASVSDDKESPLVGGDEKKYGRWRKGTARKHSYTQHGQPCKVDTVITSPPYEGSLEGTTRHTRGGIASRDPALAQTGSYATVMSFGVPVGYSPNKDNIGNLKKETYLEAMLQVYSEMFRVLKPNGLAIIIVKPFIRNKRVVDLPWHTWLLMAKAGFTLEKLYKLRLKQQSFWRILQYKNNPHLERICHEYVIVAKKPTAA
jgi:DNA modification methylase